MDSTIFNHKNGKNAKNTSPCPDHPPLYTGCGRPKPLQIDSIFYKRDPNMQRQLFTAITSGKLKKVSTAHPTVHIDLQRSRLSRIMSP